MTPSRNPGIFFRGQHKHTVLSDKIDEIFAELYPLTINSLYLAWDRIQSKIVSILK